MKKFFSILLGISVLALSIISCTFAYTQEQQEAYQWAYKYGITTQPTIESARINSSLTRQAFAKMVVNYLENVVWVEQPTSISCYFTDENKITDDLKPYAKKACAYQIMWSNGKNFYPNDPIDRAQLWTVFSRILWWDLYNVEWKWYYVHHIKALKDVWIMNNTNNVVNTHAKRWDVFIMFKRMYEKFVSNTEKDWDSDEYIKNVVENMIASTPVRGSKNARFTIIEYTELLCPYCQNHNQNWTINSVIEQFPGEVNSISKHFIIHGEEALNLASAMECIAKLKPTVYYEAFDKAFEAYPTNEKGLIDIAVSLGVNRSALQTCVSEWKYKQTINNEMSQASQLFGVNGTPRNVIIDRETGKYTLVSGAQPVETLVSAIKELKNQSLESNNATGKSLHVEISDVFETTSYYDNGQIKSIEHRRNGILDWEQIYYYENGNIKYTCNYNYWVMDWRLIYYYVNGQVHLDWYYKNWAFEWEVISYYENGKLRWSLNYKNGILDWKIISYYDSGELFLKWNYKDWKYDWNLVWYYRNGNKRFSENFESWTWIVSYYNEDWTLIWTWEERYTNTFDAKSWSYNKTPINWTYIVYYDNGSIKSVCEYTNWNSLKCKDY